LKAQGHPIEHETLNIETDKTTSSSLASDRFERPLNIEEGTYEAIRMRILDGRIAPGAQLALADLAEELDVSTMPVRAALGRLKSEGLVRQLRNRASIVAPLEIEDFEEIQAIRSGIEAFAARLGAQRVSADDLDAMASLLERLRHAAVVEDLAEYLNLEWEFHAICYRACRRDRLMYLVKDYRRRAERYVRLVVASSPRFERALLIQELFLDTARRHDGPAAEQVVRDAIEWSVRQVTEILSG
jgi:DNA-binding GntR family transcriptional regulator